MLADRTIIFCRWFEPSSSYIIVELCPAYPSARPLLGLSPPLSFCNLEQDSFVRSQPPLPRVQSPAKGYCYEAPLRQPWGANTQSVVGDEHKKNNPYRGINTNRAFTMARVRTCLGPDNV